MQRDSSLAASTSQYSSSSGQRSALSLSASPGAQSVVAGRGASYTVSVDPPAMIGAVNLGVTGLPPGVEAAFSPGFEINGSRTLNVFTTTTTPASTSQLTITATSSSGTHTATVSLTITPAADFTMSVTPNSQTVKPGMSADYTVNIAFAGNATGPVNLSVVGLPSGASASFDHNPVTASGTYKLTVTAGPQISTAIAPMDVIGSDSAGTIKVSIAFSIIPADFSLTQAVGPVEVNAGGTVTGQIIVVGLFGTPGTVNLSAGGLPAGITATFRPSTVIGAGSSTITIATDTSMTPGDFNLTINGADASGQNLATIPLTVVPTNAAAGFFLSASPLTEFIHPGDSAFFNVNVSAPGGTIPALTFTVFSSESGVDAIIFPTGKAPGAYGLQISTSNFVPTSTALITVIATGPNGSQSIKVTLVIDSTPTGP